MSGLNLSVRSCGSLRSKPRALLRVSFGARRVRTHQPELDANRGTQTGRRYAMIRVLGARSLGRVDAVRTSRRRLSRCTGLSLLFLS